MEQSPVRPAIAGGRLGTPSRSRTAVAAGGSAVSPATARTVQRSTTRAVVSAAVLCVPDSRPSRAVVPGACTSVFAARRRLRPSKV